MAFVIQFNYFKDYKHCKLSLPRNILRILWHHNISYFAFRRPCSHSFLFIYSLHLFFIYKEHISEWEFRRIIVTFHHTFLNKEKLNLPLKVVALCSILDLQDVPLSIYVWKDVAYL